MDWRHKAACLDEDPELFFPIGNTGPALLQIEEAKQVCRRCDVRDACLQWALEAGQDHGVWGGLSEDERRACRGRADGLPARSCLPFQPPACSRSTDLGFATCANRSAPAARGRRR
jgi:WhiB family transcriptional regulator, redox-sensing transcriptional regulator